MSQKPSPTLNEIQEQIAAGNIPIDPEEFAQAVLLLLDGIRAASGGGGGSGITQLTGDVTAGPGSGSVAATVAAIQGVVISGTPSAGQGLIATAANAAHWAAIPSLTVPGANTTIPVSNGAGGFTATRVTIDPITDLIASPGTGNVAGTPALNLGMSGAANMFTIADDNSAIPTGAIVISSPSFGRNMRFSPSGGIVYVSGSVNPVITDAATNTVVNALTLTHATSATAAAGLGVAEMFQLPSDAGTLRTAGQISVLWTVATNGNENSVMGLQVINSGSPLTVAEFSPGTCSIASAAISLPNIADDGSVHVQTGSFQVSIGGVARRILTADP